MITYNVDGVKMPKIKKRETTAWIRAVAATYGYKVGEVGYMFVDDEKILEVNNEYLGHDYYTDVITFDYDEPGIVSGDIVIARHRAHQRREIRQTVRRRAAPRDNSRHTASLRYQRQGTGRTRDNGGRREQGTRHAAEPLLRYSPTDAHRLQGCVEINNGLSGLNGFFFIAEKSY